MYKASIYATKTFFTYFSRAKTRNFVFFAELTGNTQSYLLVGTYTYKNACTAVI